MKRIPSVLAVGLVALLVMGVSASAHQFTSSKTPVVLTGEQHVNKHVISIGTAKIECEEAKAVGTVAENPFDSFTVVPSFQKCVFGPFGAAEIKVNHCAVIFDSDTTVANEPPLEHAAAEIECTGTDQIEMVAPGCTLKIGAQKDLHGLTYTNAKTGTKKELTVHTTFKKIAYTKSGASCFLISGEMQLNGTATFKGYEDTKKVEGTDRTTGSSYAHNNVQVDVTVE